MVALRAFSSDTETFYQSVEDELKEQQFPELTTERIQFREGGLLSAHREYLRVHRELLVFDICSAEFGTAWCFSCRGAVIPRTLRLVELALSLLGLGSFAGLYFMLFGLYTGGIVLGVTVLMLLLMLVTARSWNGLDDLLLQLPVVGSLYEAIFRAESYYRDDARRMYVSLVDPIVREKVREFAAAGGVSEVLFNEISDVQQVSSVFDRAQTQLASVVAQIK